MQKEIITIRVPHSIKTKLISEATKWNTTVSRVASKILTEHYEKTTNTKQDKHAIVTTKQISNKGNSPKRRP